MHLALRSRGFFEGFNEGSQLFAGILAFGPFHLRQYVIGDFKWNGDKKNSGKIIGIVFNSQGGELART
jgi:hypothetical protein